MLVWLNIVLHKMEEDLRLREVPFDTGGKGEAEEGAGRVELPADLPVYNNNNNNDNNIIIIIIISNITTTTTTTNNNNNNNIYVIVGVYVCVYIHIYIYIYIYVFIALLTCLFHFYDAHIINYS